MGKNLIVDAFKSAGKFINDHDIEILMGTAIGGFISGSILVGIATVKATRTIDVNKIEAEKHEIEYTKKEMIQDTWKYYIPAGLTIGGATIISIYATSEGHKRTTTLSAAYELSKDFITRYQAEVIKEIGEKKEHVIRDNLAKESVSEKPPVSTEVIITGNGDYLCFDAISKRYFRSTQLKIDKAIVELNKDMYNGLEPYKSYNDYAYEIGLPSLDDTGDTLIWDINKGAIEPCYSYVSGENGEPCLVVDFYSRPTYKERFY